jgi:hypothetical protein
MKARIQNNGFKQSNAVEEYDFGCKHCVVSKKSTDILEDHITSISTEEKDEQATCGMPSAYC